MQDGNEIKPAEQNPIELTGLEKGRVKDTAAGLKAVAISAKTVFAEAGVRRGLKALNALNKKDGFDCPSCAWPDPDDERSKLGEYCENGAKAVAEEATRKKISAEFFRKNPVQEISRLSDLEIGKKGRIAEPLYLPKGSGHYQPISWDNAFSKIASHLNGLRSPDEAIFYTSGRTSNEAAFLYQLFVREFGTNNLPDCSNMCHESSGVALGESLGIGKGSVRLDDFYQAEVIIILGQNPGTNHPRMLTALQKAKSRGAVIVSVNPLPEAGLMGFANPQQITGLAGKRTPLTDIFLPVTINGDMPLLQAVAKLMLEEEKRKPGSVFDLAFIRNSTNGYDEYVRHLESLDIDLLIRQSGLDKKEVYRFAELLFRRSRIIACWAMGLTQHKNAVDTIKEIANLLLLKGSIGKPGAGTCPVRGHSNVQGDRTMGIWERPSAGFLDALDRNFGINAPRNHGLNVVESIKAMHNGTAKVFFSLGGNFLSASPDTGFTAEALRRCALTVHVSTKLNRSHLIHGEEAIILPCLARSDKDVRNGKEEFVSCENSMGVVQASRGVLEPISDQLLSECEIVCRLARTTLGARSRISWDKYMLDYDVIRNDIARTIPGFESYNERVRQPAGFYLPNCNREGKFNTLSGKAHFNIATFTGTQPGPGELLLMTIRSHDQFNTTIYGLDDRYRGIYNERRVVLLNRADMLGRDLKDGETVDVCSDHDGRRRVARNFVAVEYPIPKGCAAMYFPEANVLVPLSRLADKSGTPASKSIIVSLQKAKLAYNKKQKNNGSGVNVAHTNSQDRSG